MSEFRGRLIAGGQETELLDHMLKQWREQGLVKARGQQRTDSTAVLANIRQLNRLSCVGETMRRALNAITVAAPEWLLEQVSRDWFDRYGPRFDSYRLPKNKGEQEELRTTIGTDGWHLLTCIYQESPPAFVAKLPAVEVLRLVWVQNYHLVNGQLQWRVFIITPPKRLLIQSPYDYEARNGTKRNVNWTGYTVHLSETCDEDTPNIITNVETRQAATTDVEVTDEIHAALVEKQLPPVEHFVDAGYTSAPKLLYSQENDGIELTGPVLPDSSWQARANQGYDGASFAINWEEQYATCPQGKVSVAWRKTHDKHKQKRVAITFAEEDCLACTQRSKCTQSKTNPRTLTFYPQPIYEVLQSARKRQKTDEFKEHYHRRAGIEGTISQGTRSFGLRRARYIGLAKTHLQNVAIAAAMNLTRMVAWLDEIPKGKTRQSRFETLATSF